MKKILSMLLIITVFLSGFFSTPELFTVFATDANVEIPHVGTAQYEEWKKNYLNKTAGSVFSSRSVDNSNVSGNKMHNTYLELAVSSDGKYTIGTSGGDPDVLTDDYKRLLYGHPSPNSSYTTIRVDGKNYKYGEGSFVILPSFDEQSNSNLSEQLIAGASVKQILSFVKNSATDREDVVEIKYIIKNTSSSPMEVGVRIMMDTMLGGNDAAPFRIPGIGAVTEEREYVANALPGIPSYWQAFDNLNNPQVVSQGTFFRTSASKPDRVQFANWGRVHSNPWGYSVNTAYAIGDSAVCAIWDTEVLEAGEEREYVTYYGLSELSQDLRPPLAVSFFGDSSVESTQNGYEPNPFTVTVYVQNIGNAPASNVKASINLPEGLKLPDYETQVKSAGNLSIGGERQISWSVLIEPCDIDRILEYSIDIWADKVENKNIKKEIRVPRGLLLKRTGKFKYTSTASKEVDYEATYYYDDAYFLDKSNIYNSSLATMSLCFAMASGGSNEKPYAEKSDNAKDLLTQIGFTQFEKNTWFAQKPTADSIGVVAANKRLNADGKEYTLIAVGVRGFGYEQEWASNFTLGEYGQHQGFNKAKNDVIAFLEEYIEENGITGDIKLWITGFSRAGGTANLVAGELDRVERIGECTLDPSDLFAYTFEAPRGTTDSDATKNELYENIFNIVNPADPVPKVAPAEFKFSRYGVDKELPSPEQDEKYFEKKRMMTFFYNKMESLDFRYDVDDFSMMNIGSGIAYILFGGEVKKSIKNNETQGVFLEQFVTRLAKERFKSRPNYVEEFQEGIRETFQIIFGSTDTVDGKKDVKWTEFKTIFEDKLKSHAGILVLSAIPMGAKLLGSNSIDLVEKYTVESLNEANISSWDEEDIEVFAQMITDTIISFAKSHPNYVATLICNIKEIGSAHYPELCLAWMQSLDKNYTDNEFIDLYHINSYRILRINCPVDVEVYDEENVLLAHIKNDEPQTIEESSIIASINEDGEKVIYLPASVEYIVKLTPTDKGYMTYSVSEFNTVVGDNTRLVNYYDISIEPGEVYTGKVPAYSEEDVNNGTENGSSTEYKLFDSENVLIAASEDLRGMEATEAYYMVYAVADNDEYGYVIGQGIRQKGNYAQVTAMPFENCEFEGWYINGQKVSSELQYRFRVQEDVEIIGKFTNNSEPENTTEKCYEGKSFKVTFSLVEQWEGGYNANIKIENTGNAVIENWYLSYDLKNVLTSMWNAEVVSYELGQYVVKNAGWNADIPVGGSVQYGISVNEDFSGFPNAYELLGENMQLEENIFSTEYYLDSDWGSGFTGRILITNKSDRTIEDWMLEFDFGREITSIWGAMMESHEGTRYVIKNVGYNANIAAGQTVVIGFNGEGGDVNQEPVEYMLSSYSKK